MNYPIFVPAALVENVLVEELIKDLSSFHQNKYVMQFLLGLNEAFTQFRGQLLLMEQMPHVNKVFSLVSQDDKQRSLGSQTCLLPTPSNNNMAFAFNNRVPKSGSSEVDQFKKPIRFQKERPYFTRCQINGHTIDTCYRSRVSSGL